MPLKRTVNNNPIGSGTAPEAQLNQQLNPAFFQYIQEVYKESTGYNLVYADLAGTIQMGLPDCDKFPCMHTCRECRERIISESLRTGKVCVDKCHDGFLLWGLPLALEGRISGGLIVIGINADFLDQEKTFEAACRELFEMMERFDLLPAVEFPEQAAMTYILRFIYRDAFSLARDKFSRSGALFIEALQTSECMAAHKHLENIRDVLKSCQSLPLDLVQGMVGEFIFNIQNRFVGAGFDPYPCLCEAGDLIRNLAQCKENADLLLLVDQVYERFGLLAEQNPIEQDDLLIQKVTTFLEEHVREELSREHVASKMGVSPSHLSRLIREKTGRTFTDLLNQYRIERASKLLLRSPKSLAEIANETGFCDQSYFSKVFRKYKNFTPSEYREHFAVKDH